MGRRKRRAFTEEYKAEVVALVRKSGKSIGAIAKDQARRGRLACARSRV